MDISDTDLEKATSDFEVALKQFIQREHFKLHATW